MNKPDTVVLAIADGWGLGPPAPGNAIYQARTPVMDALAARAGASKLAASGEAVGVPAGQIGNSEIGHVTMGAGRRIKQSISRIDEAINTGQFATNPVLVASISGLAKDTVLHIVCLLSDAGVHAVLRHIKAALAAGHQWSVPTMRLHVITDGRDSAPDGAGALLTIIETACAQYPDCRIASVCGRFWALDRDNNWARTETAWQLMARGHAQHHYATAQQAVEAARREAVTDEFVQPAWIGEAAPMTDGDAVWMLNFRADRARQLAMALGHGQAGHPDDFCHFDMTGGPALSSLVTLTQYGKQVPARVAFDVQDVPNTLGEWLSVHGIRQYRIAETEKYAHVTFFFNNGAEAPFSGETRSLVPSPKVTNYAECPQMHIEQVSQQLSAAIESGDYEVLVCNFANADMVGHTGELDAVVQACEAVDKAIGELLAVCQRTGSVLLVTADHGNAEAMLAADGTTPQPAHTTNLVPFYHWGVNLPVRHGGELADIAPTILHLLGLPKPAEMTGISLFGSK